jgi:hypothetical protein
MRRRGLIVLSTLALTAGGCAWNRRPSTATTVIPPTQMQKKLVHNRERLAGPDSPRHLAHTYFGVDTTGEGPLGAFMHVVAALPHHLYRTVEGDTPIKYAAAMENAKSPDARRTGILQLANYRFARTNPIYAKRWDQIATDPAADPTVRAAAIRAMNHARDKRYTQTFVDALNDTDPAVRLEAAKALTNLPNDAAVPKLIDHLQQDDNEDVRIACADALRLYKTPEVARALVSVLPERQFGVAYRARESLILMTGHNFRFDEAAWLEYFAKAQKPFI